MKYSEKCNDNLSDEEYVNKYESKISKDLEGKEKKVMVIHKLNKIIINYIIH